MDWALLTPQQLCDPETATQPLWGVTASLSYKAEVASPPLVGLRIKQDNPSKVLSCLLAQSKPSINAGIRHYVKES